MNFQENLFTKYRKEGALFITTDNSGTHSTTITERDRVVVVDSALGVGTINLPNVSKCAGLLFSIYMLNGGNDITIADNIADAAFGPTVAGDFDGTGDALCLYCDGYGWHVLSELIG